MATINTAPSQVATSALESLPLENIIGAPLDACIKAQAQAAVTAAVEVIVAAVTVAAVTTSNL